MTMQYSTQSAPTVPYHACGHHRNTHGKTITPPRHPGRIGRGQQLGHHCQIERKSRSKMMIECQDVGKKVQPLSFGVTPLGDAEQRTEQKTSVHSRIRLTIKSLCKKLIY